MTNRANISEQFNYNKDVLEPLKATAMGNSDPEGDTVAAVSDHITELTSEHVWDILKELDGAEVLGEGLMDCVFNGVEDYLFEQVVKFGKTVNEMFDETLTEDG